MKIRKTTIKELKTIINLNHALFQEDAGTRDPFTNLNWPYEEGKKHFTKRIKGENNVCLLAEKNNEVIGYITGYIKKPDTLRPIKIAELESMFVKEKHRNKGVGKLLFKEFKKWSKGKRAERISVTAYSANKKAVNFYKKLRFEPKSLTLESEII
jgi:GNAT superfamily N-acetyltransferase